MPAGGAQHAGQTVVPPGVHESGEPIGWAAFTEPAEVELADLLAAARAVAAVGLLGRHWVGRGTRQDAYLALAGALLRAWATERAGRFVEALAVVTGDEEPRKRTSVVAQTARKLEDKKHVTGWPRLEELLGDRGKAQYR